MSSLLSDLKLIVLQNERSEALQLPELDKVVFCLESLWFLFFPDHRRSNKYFLAGASKDHLEIVLENCQKELSRQISRALSPKISEMESSSLTEEFLSKLPRIKQALVLDAEAAFHKDPAAESLDEIILSYPGFLALMTYRIAHEFSLLKIPLLARMMSEYAHSLTGCDIHPDARIGKSFFVDHSTGVVIGQTAVIGDRVVLYQGVTLGALAVKPHMKNSKRHPTIEDDVVIYSHATILGGDTVIGKGSIIGGSCWITSSVPPQSKILLAKPQMIVTSTGEPIDYVPNWDI